MPCAQLRSVALSPPPLVSVETKVTADKPQLRFAEDIAVPGKAKPGVKSRKKKKGPHGKEEAEDGIRLKKRRRGLEIYDESESEEEY